MTSKRDPEHLIRLYLEEGRTELPDRAYDAVRGHIERTRHRTRFGPWRNTMSNIARVATGAAAVVVASVVGVTMLGSGQGGFAGPGAAATTSTSPPSSSVPSPGEAAAPSSHSQASPGFVRTSIVSTAKEGEMRVELTMPQDWTDLGWAVEHGHFDDVAPGHGVGLSIWTVSYTYEDACRALNNRVAPTLGPTVDDLVGALVAQPTVLVSTPVPVTLAGYSGKYVEVTIPESCTSEVRLLADHGNEYRIPSPGEVDRLWILDVDGRRAVIDASAQTGASTERLEELEAILDTIEFVE